MEAVNDQGFVLLVGDTEPFVLGFQHLNTDLALPKELADVNIASATI